MMERVQGIGGFFFRARDPKAVARWYSEHLGVTLTPTDYDQEAWRQEAGDGWFARLTDPEGNPIQLWQPA